MPEGDGPWAIGDPAVEGGISPSDGNANQGDAGVCYCFPSPCGLDGNASKLADTAGGSRKQWLEKCVESGTVTPPLPIGWWEKSLRWQSDTINATFPVLYATVGKAEN
ncbi:hypothetical protein K523DRAFT_422394 [Schizophyllum commune Tattone D]|nr:hypothetical protein K523DRAFT_422394 [Schizophyllum commune Tattone D]